jgi:thiamine pyrophosphokinase
MRLPCLTDTKSNGSYSHKGVPVVQSDDQDSTDLMKCVSALQSKEQCEGRADSYTHSGPGLREQYDIILLGGLTGRLDQTIHTLSYLHKLRKSRKRVYVVTDDNVGWVLDSVRPSCHSLVNNHSLTRSLAFSGAPDFRENIVYVLIILF